MKILSRAVDPLHRGPGGCPGSESRPTSFENPTLGDGISRGQVIARTEWCRLDVSLPSFLSVSELSSVSVVVSKQATEPSSAEDFAVSTADFISSINDSVLESLVIALVMKVLGKLLQGSAQ